jgi:hypothetical protein
MVEKPNVVVALLERFDLSFDEIIELGELVRNLDR